MLRVLRPGGRVAVSVWCPIEENPYFLTLADTVAQHLGPGAAVWLEAPFALTNHQYIFTLLNSAGLHDVEVTARQLDLELPPLEEFAHGHIRTTSISGDFSAAPRGVQQTVISSIVEQLAPFKAQGPDGSGISGNVRIPFRSYLAVARVR